MLGIQMKRIFDFVVAIVGLSLLFPFLLFIGMLIKIDDNGPVFFKQERVGKGGKLFILYKFRSMKAVDVRFANRFAPGDLSRLTRFGRILRVCKIDELPQLFNVLKGEMSLVGPRPEVQKWVGVYPQRWKLVLSVRPGITDYASILFRNEERTLVESCDPEADYKNIILPKKLDHYEDYILNRSFSGDMKIICKTFISLLKIK